MIHFHDIMRHLDRRQIGANLANLPDQWMKNLRISAQESLSRNPAETVQTDWEQPIPSFLDIPHSDRSE